MAARYCVSFKTGDCLSLDSIGLAAVVEPAISEVDARFMEPVKFFVIPARRYTKHPCVLKTQWT